MYSRELMSHAEWPARALGHASVSDESIASGSQVNVSRLNDANVLVHFHSVCN